MLFADAVYSVPQQWLATATGGVEWHGRAGRRLALELARYRPVFDLSSIWASFWADPSDDARLHGQWPLGERVTFTASCYLRRYALGESGPSTNGGPVADLWNGGGSAALILRAPAYEASLRARGEGGSVGARVGVDAAAWWWMLPERLRIDARLSLWHVRDELRPHRGGLSVGGVVGATLRLGTLADLHVDVEDDANPVVGHRFRLLAVLALRGVL